MEQKEEKTKLANETILGGGTWNDAEQQTGIPVQRLQTLLRITYGEDVYRKLMKTATDNKNKKRAQKVREIILNGGTWQQAEQETGYRVNCLQDCIKKEYGEVFFKEINAIAMENKREMTKACKKYSKERAWAEKRAEHIKNSENKETVAIVIDTYTLMELDIQQLHNYQEILVIPTFCIEELYALSPFSKQVENVLDKIYEYKISVITPTTKDKRQVVGEMTERERNLIAACISLQDRGKNVQLCLNQYMAASLRKIAILQKIKIKYI